MADYLVCASERRKRKYEKKGKRGVD